MYDSSIQAILVVSSLFSVQGYSDPWNPDPARSIPTSVASNSPSVFSSCDSSGNFLATWLDSSANVPYYSIYTQSTGLWSSPATITSASPGASGTMVLSSFDSSTGNFLATWQNSSDNTSYFSIEQDCKKAAKEAFIGAF